MYCAQKNQSEHHKAASGKMHEGKKKLKKQKQEEKNLPNKHQNINESWHIQASFVYANGKT